MVYTIFGEAVTLCVINLYLPDPVFYLHEPIFLFAEIVFKPCVLFTETGTCYLQGLIFKGNNFM
jgi:hypothetical protein